MSGGEALVSPGETPGIDGRSARGRLARVAARWSAGALMATAVLVAPHGFDDPAVAQTSVAPVLSCPAGMALDSSGGQCLTLRTETVLRPSSCSGGSVRVPGEYGGHVCQRKVTRNVDTGRTRQAYSHTTYAKVWIPTGTKTVQTGTNRRWVPARRVVEPLVPPVRVQVGTRTKSRVVTRPGPEVLYKVNYEATVSTKRVVRRCSYDPVAGRQCWNQTVTTTRTETRTRLECCVPGPPITKTVTTEVPVYEWRTTHTTTIPGYWSEDPVYETRETGYWDRVPTIHYTTVPINEAVVEWVTTSVTRGPCPSGWQAAGRQCSRTVLGPPSTAPTQSCPSGSVPRYGDALGGTGPSVLTCQSSAPGSNPDTGAEQEGSGGPDDSPDGGARPLHRLAGESDERLAELGIHRCANGLLSYVPCDELPGRTWDSDPDVCDGIEGTTYRRDHGGSCVTESDLLNKCTTPGDCEETTIRTYCPAIGELANTQIQQHAHPHRGAETYRVCIFDCSSFGTLPRYVQTRINGSYDYACLPAPEDDEEPPPTTTTAPTTTTTTEREQDEEDDPVDGDPVDDDPVDDDPVGPPGPERPVDTEPPPVPECDLLPPESLLGADADELTWKSNVVAAGRREHQTDMPGGGAYLQTAPGRGWMETAGSLDVADGHCNWVATSVRTTWSELQPWDPADRARMAADDHPIDGTQHLVARWDALSPQQQQTVRRWRANPVELDATCTVRQSRLTPSARTDCAWVLSIPGAYVWSAQVCLQPVPGSGSPRRAEPGDDPLGTDADCWITLDEGIEWIRSVGDYADGRVTLTGDGSGS
ncbi:hypothetical protein [Candidatus Poriferisodalis sp.]|uniref:hypothetical protein n=1 Tax=Candidatus Poriferisodalis sp. TaxID=3101277 RepID=UPI003B0186DF